MGYANYTNLSRFFVRRLYAKGKLSMKEAVDAAVNAKETMHASECDYPEPYMLGMAFEEIVWFLLKSHSDGTKKNKGFFEKDCSCSRVVEPVEPLTDEQKNVLELWHDNDSSWPGVGDEPEGNYATLDSIQWKFCKGWRKRYPDIPLLGNVTH